MRAGLKRILAVGAFCLLATEALAAMSGGATGDACLEQLYECQRGCGPSQNPQCLRYCEEQVFAKCKGTASGTVARPSIKKMVPGGRPTTIQRSQ